MSEAKDFKLIDVAAMQAVKVTTLDEDGNDIPDPNWHREGAETDYVLAEFLAQEQLLVDGVDVTRSSSLVIHWSQLTETGQKFVRSDYEKWLRSIDQSGTPEGKKREKLQKRWAKYSASNGIK